MRRESLQEASRPGSPASAEVKSAELDESDFLRRQAEEAKAAVTRLFAEIAGKLGQGASPVSWAKQYPWVTLGAAAVAGFVGTAVLVPSKEQQALNKLAAIERALHPPPPPKPKADVDPDGHEDAKSYKPGSHSILTVVLREILGAIRPALVSLLTAGVTAKVAKPSEEEMEAASAHEQVKERAGAAG